MIFHAVSDKLLVTKIILLYVYLILDNGHITEEPDPNTPILRPYSGLEMPS